jgi:hypothetical protein
MLIYILLIHYYHFKYNDCCKTGSYKTVNLNKKENFS